MKRFLAFTMTLCLALSLAAGCTAEETTPAFELADFTAIYGWELPALEEQAAPDDEVYQTMSCRGVQVTLKQALYDGVWVFTTATAAPENPQEAVVMPGSASYGDRYAGMNGEGRRTEEGSFLDVATQQQKRLLAVYAYPQEFNEQEYFTDYLQDSGDLSLLIAGCGFDAPSDTPMTLHWMVQVYEVDPVTQAYTLLEQKLLPLALQPMPSTVTEYKTTGNSTPLSGCTLLRTALTTYVFPVWKTGIDPYMYGVTPLDGAGTPYAIELPWAYNSYAIDATSATLTFQLENFGNGTLSTVSLKQR